MCQILSYDDNYYADRNNYHQVHEEFDNVSKIGSNTRKAICYEFITIYSELLKDMGIIVSPSTKLFLDVNDENQIIYTRFDDNHANLRYVIDNMIIFADSTTSILYGDLINAKMHKELNGLKCLNVNSKIQQQFNEKLQKVYQNMPYENNNFKQYDSDFKNKPLVERMKIFFNDINNVNYETIDFISYITYLKKQLFTNDELDWNINISYIGKNNDGNKYPVTLISINTNNIKNVPQDTTYYLFDTNEKHILNINKEELEEMFQNETIFYLDVMHHIPNIDYNQKKVRVFNTWINFYILNYSLISSSIQLTNAKLNHCLNQ